VIVALGKPKAAKSFGDYADSFTETIIKSGQQFKRIDVIFDRYYETPYQLLTSYDHRKYGG